MKSKLPQIKLNKHILLGIALLVSQFLLIGCSSNLKHSTITKTKTNSLELSRSIVGQNCVFEIQSTSEKYFRLQEICNIQSKVKYSLTRLDTIFDKTEYSEYDFDNRETGLSLGTIFGGVAFSMGMGMAILNDSETAEIAPSVLLIGTGLIGLTVYAHIQHNSDKEKSCYDQGKTSCEKFKEIKAGQAVEEVKEESELKTAFVPNAKIKIYQDKNSKLVTTNQNGEFEYYPINASEISPAEFYSSNGSYNLKMEYQNKVVLEKKESYLFDSKVFPVWQKKYDAQMESENPGRYSFCDSKAQGAEEFIKCFYRQTY